MKATTIIATILSMAAFAIAAPVGMSCSNGGGVFESEANYLAEVDARQNHGMCVKSTAGQVEQIANC